jgi:Icc-related predicted phosphoesterase
MIIVDVVSDLHGFYPALPGGDLLIIAGDCTKDDTLPSWGKFFKWVERQKYRKKVMIAGNHDNFCKSWATSGTFTDEAFQQIYPGEMPVIDYLCDSGMEFVVYPELSQMEEGKSYDRPKVKIWGSPWTTSFKGMNPHCKAFTVDSDEELFDKWALIPKDVDILITHSPPYGIVDKTMSGKNVGSKSLKRAMDDLDDGS